MKKIIFILSIFVTIGSSAQDFHLSQLDACPLYLNPALTGLRLDGEGKFRLNGNYRSQGSKSLGTANTTTSVGFDTQVDNKFSIGQYIINHNTYDRLFNMFNVMMSGAYNIIKPSEAKNQNLSVGLQMGIMQRSMHPNNFRFESQYSELEEDGFDEAIPSGESFGNQSFFSFDANFGMYYRYQDAEKKKSPFGGFSIYHLTQPNQSFTGITSKVPMRFLVQGGCRFKIGEEFALEPQFIFMNQANVGEFNFTTMGYFKLTNSGMDALMGASYRHKDAVVFHLGIKQHNYVIRVSYDITTSYLKQFTNARNGLELSLIIMGRGKKNNTSDKVNKEETKKTESPTPSKVIDDPAYPSDHQ